MGQTDDRSEADNTDSDDCVVAPPSFATGCTASGAKGGNGRSIEEESLESVLRDADREMVACEEAFNAARKKLVAARNFRQEIADQLESLQNARLQSESAVQWKHTQPWTEELRRVCWEFFNVGSFRRNQEETLNAVLGGRDVFLVAPTGAGKSLCFQAPALVTKKLTVVISPLLSLMHDQVLALRAVGIRAAMLSSNESREDQNKVRADLKALVPAKTAKARDTPSPDGLLVVYVTPERIAKSKLFMSVLEQIYGAGRLGLLAIDEAHCISQWGHDFRPDYEKLAALRVQFPKTPILALTATANSTVAGDVQKSLGIRGLEFRSPTNRSNLFYMVRHRPKAPGEVLAAVARSIRLFPRGTPGIVYCFTRKEAESVCQGLCTLEDPVPAVFYHGDLDAATRHRIYDMWVEGTVNVIVATVAFGMGINKSDVRFVIHAGLPSSLHHYYQEAGRAGRDGLPALCLLLYRPSDIPRHSVMNYYKPAALRELYDVARYCQEACCRRKMLSRHFGEEVPPCKSHCDVCYTSPKVDVEGPVRKKLRRSAAVDEMDLQIAALKLVTEANSAEEPVTMLKLGEKMQRVCKATGEERLEDMQYAIMAMLSTQYLQETFKHSPYATNAYLSVTAKGERVLNGSESVSSDARVLSIPPLLLRMQVVLGPVKTAQVEVATSSQIDAGTRDRRRLLHKLRDRIGREMGIPGKFVLTDAEMYALAASSRTDSLLNALPVAKRRLYGESVLAIVGGTVQS